MPQSACVELSAPSEDVAWSLLEQMGWAERGAMLCANQHWAAIGRKESTFRWLCGRLSVESPVWVPATLELAGAPTWRGAFEQHVNLLARWETPPPMPRMPSEFAEEEAFEQYEQVRRSTSAPAAPAAPAAPDRRTRRTRRAHRPPLLTRLESPSTSS